MEDRVSQLKNLNFFLNFKNNNLNRAIFYKNKYLQSISNKRTREVDNYDKSNDCKAKQARVIRLFQDPMEVLPKNCKLNILKYFKGIELLKMMEVSKTWKYEIESNTTLMNQSMKRIKLLIKDECMKTDVEILMKNNRFYRHLELIDCFEEKFCLMGRYSSLLQSLTIKDSANFFRAVGNICEFPNLRNLTLHHFDDSWFSWLINCSFPNLDEFRYTNNFSVYFDPYRNDWIESLNDFLCKNESLQNLYMRTHGSYGLDSLETASELTRADFGYGFPFTFLSDHEDTLTVLHAGCTIQHLSIILRSFKNLHTLAIDLMEKFEEEDELEEDEDCRVISQEIKLKKHNEIVNLKIQTEEPKIMRQIIDALPELRTLLTYNFFTKKDVEFLGRFIFFLI